MVAAKSILAILGFASSGLAYTVPRDFPKIVQRGVFKENTTNGFPNKTSTNADLQIAMEAGGKLPQGPLPTNLSDAAITAWQLIAFNEIFEVAFFSAVNYNLTHNVKGFDLNSTLKSDAQKIVNAVRAQEQQHALGALAVLKENKAFQPSACEYNVPSDNLTTSIALANTITDVVLGVLTGANMVFANDSSIPSVEIISSVIGQEGEQNGAYRGLLGRIPSSAPFLTPVPPAFAWSALQLFVVPGSCGFSLDRINLTIFPPLSVNGSAIAVVPPTDTPLSFEADLTNYTMTNDQSPKLNDYINKTSGLYATFTTGLQYPVSVEAKNVKWSGKTVSFDAEFPYNETVAGGFSHAALTTEKNITSFLEVPNYALTGPAVIQANVTY